ncbi:MAG: hypothetical protein MAG795_00439 [Candidatus Woesearchaeota archaeon]|nr:hypothetical protein [Candidatus Woesearchaeota archaeon]
MKKIKWTLYLLITIQILLFIGCTQQETIPSTTKIGDLKAYYEHPEQFRYNFTIGNLDVTSGDYKLEVYVESNKEEEIYNRSFIIKPNKSFKRYTALIPFSEMKNATTSKGKFCLTLFNKNKEIHFMCSDVRGLAPFHLIL